MARALPRREESDEDERLGDEHLLPVVIRADQRLGGRGHRRRKQHEQLQGAHLSLLFTVGTGMAVRVAAIEPLSAIGCGIVHSPDNGPVGRRVAAVGTGAKRTLQYPLPACGGSISRSMEAADKSTLNRK